MSSRRRAIAAIATLLGFTALGCDSPSKQNPFEPSPSAAKEPPPIKEPPKPQGQPHLTVDTVGIKVGFNRVMTDKPEGRQQLTQEIDAMKEHIDGKDVTTAADRKAKLDWVMALFDALDKAGARTIKVKTETRKEYSPELTFLPKSKVGNAPSCSIVAEVMEDYATAVWRLQGGTAMRRSKGFAGPDLTMTLDTVERLGKSCPTATSAFVSAAEGIEWGLVYDLAASMKTLSTIRLETMVLLSQRPTPGHKVDL